MLYLQRAQPQIAGMGGKNGIFKLRNITNLKAMRQEDIKWTEWENMIPLKTAEENNKEHLQAYKI